MGSPSETALRRFVNAYTLEDWPWVDLEKQFDVTGDIQ